LREERSTVCLPDQIRIIPEWEFHLWSCLGQGNGLHCPRQCECATAQSHGCPYASSPAPFPGPRSAASPVDSEKAAPGCLAAALMETLAQEWLQEKGVRYPPVPPSLVSLADDQHRIEIRLAPLKFHHGAIWWVENQWVIYLRRDDSWGAQRFTLFHEAYHILSRNRIQSALGVADAPRGPFSEFLANCFAAALLMPQPWVKEYATTVLDTRRLASLFDVPRAYMQRRLKQLSLIATFLAITASCFMEEAGVNPEALMGHVHV
jgi:Zn-dependent peptidase ImmA (M78 family)